MLRQHCIGMLSSQCCPNTSKTISQRKSTCAMLVQSAQIYLRRKGGCFKYVWQPVFQPGTISSNSLGSFCSMLAREFIYLFIFSYFIQSRVFYPQLTLRQLIQPDLKSRFIVRSQLGPSFQLGLSLSVGLQLVTQSAHLSKN